MAAMMKPVLVDFIMAAQSSKFFGTFILNNSV